MKHFINPQTTNKLYIDVTGDEDSQSFVTCIKHNQIATAKKLPCSIKVVVATMSTEYHTYDDMSKSLSIWKVVYIFQTERRTAKATQCVKSIALTNVIDSIIYIA